MDEFLNKKDEFDIFLKQNLSKDAPLNFSDKVMKMVEAETAKRKVIQPLIGKSTWLAISFFIFVMLLLPLFIENPSSLENGIKNLQDYGNKMLLTFQSIWVYVMLGIIILWELLFRRVLKVA